MTTDVNLPRHVALYREVCRQPECDTLRLAYADALDEAGDHDRAEFIRLQCELARLLGKWPGTETFTDEGIRANQLRDAHPEWRKCPCPACGGVGHWMEKDYVPYGGRSKVTCRTCCGTGDLFVTRRPGVQLGDTKHAPRAVAFARGFVGSVECTAADVWREEACLTNSRGSGIIAVPTEWAKVVVRESPVTRFVATDLAPRHVSDVLGKGWTWPRRMTLPDPVRDLLASTGGVQQPAFNSGYVRWETEQLCRDALAVALGKWVRVAAYPAASVG